MRAWLVAVVLSACAGRAPPRDGCLEVVRHRKQATLVDRGVAEPGPFSLALAGATADDARAHAYALRALVEERGATASLVLGIVAVGAGTIVGLLRPAREQNGWIGSGAAFASGGLGGAIGLAVASGRDEDRALATYNGDCRR